MGIWLLVVWLLAGPWATVVLDPGHGGVDPGAVGIGGVPEKVVNLAVAHRIARRLQGAGVRVILTRAGDKDPGRQGRSSKRAGLWRRVHIAERAHADAFLSIHCDQVANPAVRGAALYYAPEDAVGLGLADVLTGHLRRATRVRGQPKPLRQFILRRLPMAAATIELGFVSNPVEARELTSPAFQERLAHAIADGLLAYLHGARLRPVARPHPPLQALIGVQQRSPDWRFGWAGAGGAS